MNHHDQTAQAERRAEPRTTPASHVGVRRVMPVMPLSDAEVLNISASGVAIRTRVPLKAGERLSFAPGVDCPPILAEVLACEPVEDDIYRIRCRCLLGTFDIDIDLS